MSGVEDSLLNLAWYWLLLVRCRKVVGGQRKQGYMFGLIYAEFRLAGLDVSDSGLYSGDSKVAKHLINNTSEGTG